MTALFQLDWQGVWSERRLRRRRPGIDDLPWGTLDLASTTAAELLEARRVWTNGVFTEYASAAAFGNLATALLECGAPVDLTAVAADIVVDELDHVELVARLLGELGGALPLAFDVAQISQVTTPGAPALVRALELAISVSCVGEALSVPALRRSRALVTEPLVQAVLDRLLGDEGPHAELGFRLLAWAGPQLEPADRAHLAEVALAAIASFAPLWQREACDACQAPGLGVAPAADHQRALVTAVRERVVARLARHDVHVDGAALAALLPAAAV
ncbi:MAG: ferritin-like domain-containing protein [Myxococcales bacterium]|nr:ferritin-like domain-containing protein [Myxococcales bacterium]